MSVSAAGHLIADTVSQWEGISELPHRFGGVECLPHLAQIGAE